MVAPQRAVPAVTEPRTMPTVDFVSAEEMGAPRGSWSSVVSFRGGQEVDDVSDEVLLAAAEVVVVCVGHEMVGVDRLRSHPHPAPPEHSLPRLVVFVLDLLPSV